jgi:hypothetical protein
MSPMLRGGIALNYVSCEHFLCAFVSRLQSDKHFGLTRREPEGSADMQAASCNFHSLAVRQTIRMRDP